MNKALTPSRRAKDYIPLSIPHMGRLELGLIREAFRTNYISTSGPNLTQFEKEFSEFTGLPTAAVSCGTVGIHLAVRLAGIGPGDEVVVPTLTFVGGCNPVLYEKGIPVFIDSERRSWNMDPELLDRFLKKRARVNKMPKAIIVAHLFGQSADMDPILSAARSYEIPVIEDAAESLGASYKLKLTGTLGEVGVYSFNGNKIITSSSGGAVVSPNAAWVDKARFWSKQARDPDRTMNYRHSEIGYNYRMSNILAGIARGQLRVLPKRIQQRRAIASRYHEAFADLPGLEPMPQAEYGQQTNWLSCFLINPKVFGLNQKRLIQFLAAAHVEARPVWRPMHVQKLFKHYECVGGGVAEDLNRRGVCLPSSSCLSLEDQQLVIDLVREAHALSKRR